MSKTPNRGGIPPSKKTAGLIRAHMKEQNKTVTDLADHLGLSPWSASRRINGHHRFTLEELAITADWLGLRPEDLS